MLRFDPKEHRYFLDGRELVSVTTVLKPLYSFDRVPPDVLEHKRQIGTAAHKAIELALLDDLDHSSLSPEIAGYFQAFLKFQAEFAPRNAQSEVRVYSKHGYAGTVDLICEQNDRLWVLDFKTSAEVGPATALQTAAYAEAYADMEKDLRSCQRGAVHLKADGTYRLHPYNDRQDFLTFMACLRVYHWRQNNGC